MPPRRPRGDRPGCQKLKELEAENRELKRANEILLAVSSFFEQAVVDLLIAMGYGGAEQRVRRLGRISDGGVDGLIDQDALTPLGPDDTPRPGSDCRL